MQPSPHNRVDLVIEHIKAWAIVVVGEPLLRQRHADAGGNALPERTGRVSTPETQWYSGCPGALLSNWRKRRMSSSVTEGCPSRSYSALDGLHLCEVQNGPQQHGRRARSKARTDRGSARSGPPIEIHHPVPDGVTIGASAIGVPGWPDFACWTASI